jgi:hypothetical protein
VEQLIIAYKKLREAARLLAATNERAAEEIKISSRIRWTGKAPPFNHTGRPTRLDSASLRQQQL